MALFQAFISVFRALGCGGIGGVVLAAGATGGTFGGIAGARNGAATAPRVRGSGNGVSV